MVIREHEFPPQPNGALAAIPFPSVLPFVGVKEILLDCICPVTSFIRTKSPIANNPPWYTIVDTYRPCPGRRNDCSHALCSWPGRGNQISAVDPIRHNEYFSLGDRSRPRLPYRR
jgi:hypothetical protein